MVIGFATVNENRPPESGNSHFRKADGARPVDMIGLGMERTMRKSQARKSYAQQVNEVLATIRQIRKRKSAQVSKSLAKPTTKS